ncbi:hypothetical protein BU61_10165 [Pontoporia blainvillei]|uniref:Uncharacterized protein n=1 Tax=Pontoporia blainvillei TaxID=48723 RepID=A0ABX0S9Z7_PONBL|nr:hypothetical protein [Pontoporia blainvillei]
MGMSRTSSAEENALGELKRSVFQPARPNQYEACRDQENARRVSDITCDAGSFFPRPVPAPSRPATAQAHAHLRFRAPRYPQCSAAPNCRKGRVSAASERLAFRVVRRQRLRASPSSSCRGARVPEGVQLRLSLAGATYLRNAPQETGSGRGQQKGGAEKEGEDYRMTPLAPLHPAFASPPTRQPSPGRVRNDPYPSAQTRLCR